MGALTHWRRAAPAALAAATAAAVIASAPAPSAEAASPVVFTFPVITQPPAQVAGLPAGVQQVATGIGGNYGLALLANGTVSGWGISASANSFGELGDGTTVNHTSPAPVHNLSGITQIAGAARTRSPSAPAVRSGPGATTPTASWGRDHRHPPDAGAGARADRDHPGERRRAL